MCYLHPTVWIATVKFDPTAKKRFVNLNDSPQFAMAQICVKVFFKDLTNIGSPVYGSCSVGKPRES